MRAPEVDVWHVTVTIKLQFFYHRQTLAFLSLTFYPAFVHATSYAMEIFWVRKLKAIVIP